MKRFSLIIAAGLMIASSFAFVGCKDAIVDDGTNVKSYVNSDDGGASGGAVPFSMYNDIMDLQIWEGTFTADITDCLTITVGTVGWWGGAFVGKGSVAPDSDSVVKWDMTAVKKMSLSAKASKTGKFVIYAGSDGSAKPLSATNIDVTEEWDDYEFDVSGETDSNYSILAFGGSTEDNSIGGPWATGEQIFIKNVAYYDASGNEIVPTVKK